MTYAQAKQALDYMMANNKRWYRLEDGRMATWGDCLDVINRENEFSPESLIEQARRDI